MQNVDGNRRKRLGVIGGLGPMASAHFYSIITQMTAAESDQEHLEIEILSLPGIPDRTAFISGRSNNDPVPALITAALELQSHGAEIIAIPCVTAHCFFDQIQDMVHTRILNMVDETAACLARHNVARAGLLATEGTLTCSIFEKALDNYKIESMKPEMNDQRIVMSTIYEKIKAAREIDYISFESVTDNLKTQGADAIILGCTELSLIDKRKLTASFYDALEILAAVCVSECGAKLTASAETLLALDGSGSC
ncbi:MAG: amino acid racemase [Clostridiaceae bacterium]|nr:amino acid racemase [Clostridiaceae bacterium]